MSDGVRGIFEPIRYKGKDPPKEDPDARYKDMSDDLRNNIHSISPIISRFSDFLRKVLISFVEDKGELVIVVNGHGAHFEREGKPFTNFGVVLLGTIQVHDIGHIRHDLELLIWGQRLPPKIIRIEAKNLRSSAWIDDLGPKYICEKWGTENLKVLVQAMAQYAPVKDEYSYSGWVTDDRNVYIMSGHQLCGDTWDAGGAKTPCLHTLEMLDVAPHTLTIPLLAIAMLSLVQSRMMAVGDYFKGACCIVAPTQSFKTTLAALFFDIMNGREANVNFEATMAAIVRTVGNNRDSTVIVDDFKPGATKAEANEMVRKLSTIIRMASDNSGGIQKAGTRNETVSNVAHGLVVVTAEQVHLRVQSTLARLLILEMYRKSVDVGKLTYFQEHHDIYRTFIRDYIQHIATLGVGQYCNRPAQRFLRERNTLLNELLIKNVPVDNRTSDVCTWLWISFSEFLAYAQEVEAITPEQFESYDKEARTVFLSLMEQQAERVAELNPVKQFFRALQVLLDTKEAKIGKLQARNNGYSTVDSKSAIGFTKKGYVYLKNGIALQAVVSYYRQSGIEFTVSESALRKALADSGYLIPYDKKSYIHRLYTNHETYQCIKFSEAEFSELLKGGEHHGTKGDCEFSGDRALQQNADTILGPRD